MYKLDTSILENRLKNHPSWSFSGDSLYKEFSLRDFSSAIAFVVQVGFEAEKADHHPDIHLYNWNKVKIFLSTHSVGGVTEKDFDLLTKIETIKNDK